MKRFVFLIIFSSVILFSFAQEKIVLDSIQIEQLKTHAGQLNIDRPGLLDDSFSLDKPILFDKSFKFQPLLPDYNKNLDFSKSLSSPVIYSESFSFQNFGPSPFYTNGVIFNQASYRLNDRFSFGGNSFGAQSVFEQPRLNPTMQNMGTKGASMFMQYKVSKNFKIETRVNISNHQSPWEP